jgi:hypothetical protein
VRPWTWQREHYPREVEEFLHTHPSVSEARFFKFVEAFPMTATDPAMRRTMRLLREMRPHLA